MAPTAARTAAFPEALDPVAGRVEARIDALLAAERQRWVLVDDAQAIFDELRVELCVGQSLDLVGTATARTDAATARRIATYKSSKYTVERPLHLGAALAGRAAELAGPLSAVGLPMGEAFQLR